VSGRAYGIYKKDDDNSDMGKGKSPMLTQKFAQNPVPMTRAAP
jgi:hypothetical protein